MLFIKRKRFHLEGISRKAPTFRVITVIRVCAIVVKAIFNRLNCHIPASARFPSRQEGMLQVISQAPQIILVGIRSTRVL